MGVIEKQSIQDIADAIRDRNGLTTLYKPRQMDEAIRGLYKTEAVNHIFDNLTISTTAQGSNLVITDADATKPAEITEIRGKGKGNLIAKDNWELGSISGSGSTMGQNTPATNRIRNIEHIAVEPNTTYTLTLLGDTSTVAFVFEYNSEKVGTKRIPSTWTATPFTFTTQDTTYFVRVIFSTTDVTLGQNVELRKEGDIVVTGDNNIVVSNKNVLPFSNQNFNLKGLNYYVQNGSLFLNGTSTGETYSTDTNFKNNFSFYLEAGTYRFSWQSITGISAFIKKYEDNTNLAQLTQNISNIGFTLNTRTRVYLSFYVYNATPSDANTKLMLEKGTVATDYIQHEGSSYPITLGSIELTEQDKIWNNNGTWQLNDTAITDNYLLEQLQALDNIELYEDLCYVDWVDNVKADMSLLYYVDGEKILEEIRKE